MYASQLTAARLNARLKFFKEALPVWLLLACSKSRTDDQLSDVSCESSISVPTCRLVIPVRVIPRTARCDRNSPQVSTALQCMRQPQQVVHKQFKCSAFCGLCAASQLQCRQLGPVLPQQLFSTGLQHLACSPFSSKPDGCSFETSFLTQVTPSLHLQSSVTSKRD